MPLSRRMMQKCAYNFRIPFSTWERIDGIYMTSPIATCMLSWDADAEKNVQRLYWVQFEGYLPSKPDLKHQYNSPRHTTIGGLDFYVDTWVRPKDAETQRGSDRQRIEELIRSKGFNMPAGMIYVRLVHLLDEQKRKELMIIYGESLAPTGFSVADLSQGGKAFDRWPAIEKDLLAHAKKKITIQQNPDTPSTCRLSILLWIRA